MEKAARTLLRVAAIVSTVVGALILACVPAFLVIGISPTIHQMLVKAIEEGTIHTDVNVPAETIVIALQCIFISLAVVFIFLGGVCVANAIIASKTRNEPTKGRYVACIVTGLLSTDFSAIAAIFGLIVLSRKARRAKLEE